MQLTDTPILAFMLALLTSQVTQAAPPQSFITSYDASYAGIRVEAERRLSYSPATNLFTLSSNVEPTLFGNSTESGGRTIELDIRAASLNGKPFRATTIATSRATRVPQRTINRIRLQ